MLRAVQANARALPAATASRKRAAPSEGTDARPVPKRRRAPAKPKPLDFEKMLDRVWAYMTKDQPFSWGRSREISEGWRVTDGILKMMNQIRDRCPADAPPTLKSRSFRAMVDIWHLVIEGVGSYTHRACRQNCGEWEKPFLSVWAVLSDDEQWREATDETFVAFVVDVALQWKGYCVGEEMFDFLLQQMKDAADGEVADQYQRWDRRNEPKPEAAQNSNQRLPSTWINLPKTTVSPETPTADCTTPVAGARRQGETDTVNTEPVPAVIDLTDD